MADKVPGVSTTYIRESDVSGTAPNNRCLIFGLMAAGSLATPNVPFRARSAANVAAQTGGAWSHATRMYRAARVQADAEMWILPITDPGGTAGTRIIKFIAAPTYDATNGWELGSATALAQGTDVTVDVGGQIATASCAAGDTWATVATKVKAALDAITDLVVTVGRVNETLTLTDRHTALITDDLPVRVSFSNATSGGAASAGTLTLANNATGAGTVSLTDGIITNSWTFANTDTPAASAASLRDVINKYGPLRGALANPATGVITLYYRDDRYIRRHSASITAAVGTTVALAMGTAGAGTPTLSGAGNALEKLTADQAYKTWANPFADATSMGAAITTIIAQDAAPIEKGQLLVACISSGIPSVSLLGATSPALTTTELCTVLYYQGSPVPAAQIAARVAAEIAAEDDYGRNYNGLVLKQSESMPLAAPHRADRSTRDNWNTALTEGYAPVAVNGGNQTYVVSGRTTFAAANAVGQKLQKWAGALIPMALRAGLRQALADAFMRPGYGKSIKAHGEPKTDRAVTTKGVRSVVIAFFKKADSQDLYDFDTDIEGAVKSVVDVTPTTIKITAPFRFPADLDRIEVEAYPD